MEESGIGKMLDSFVTISSKIGTMLPPLSPSEFILTSLLLLCSTFTTMNFSTQFTLHFLSLYMLYSIKSMIGKSRRYSVTFTSLDSLTQNSTQWFISRMLSEV